MPATIRFTLGQEALLKLRDEGSCKFKKDEQVYQILIDEELGDVFLDPFDFEDEETDENLDEDTSVDEPGVEMPKDEWPKDVS